MKRTQKIQLRQSEVREAMGVLLDKEDRSDEDREKLAEHGREMRTLETDFQAAILADGEPVEPERRAAPTGTEDGESKELADLHRRSSIATFLGEAVSGNELNSGPEREYRTAIMGDDARQGVVPWEMLAQPAEGREVRVDAATSVAGTAIGETQQRVLDRVFTRSIASRLKVDMPMVPIGDAVYPVMTGGHSPAMKAAGADHSATAATFIGHTLSPVRLTGRYVFRAEDVARFRGYEATLRRDLTAAMSDAMDDQIVNGNGTAPNVRGFLHELPDPSNPTAVTTWDQFIGHFTGQIDGLNAFELSDLRAIVGKQTFAYAETLFRTGATDNGPRESAGEYVRSRIGGKSVSSRIPAASGNIQKGIIAKTSYPGRNAVAPIWQGFQMIRDPYSGAASGEVAITAVMLWNFKVLREAGWTLFESKVA